MYTHAVPNPVTRKHILFTAWKFCHHLEAGNSSVGSLACQPSAGGTETWPNKQRMRHVMPKLLISTCRDANQGWRWQ